MAKFFPTLDEIQVSKTKQPYPGESALLQELQKLSDDYEVYFQPFINKLSHPDFVVLRKGYGGIVIEVKDWNLRAYELVGSKDGSWQLREKGDNNIITTPFQQVHAYKRDLYNYYSPALHVQSRVYKRAYGLIKTAVYFNNASDSDVSNLFEPLISFDTNVRGFRSTDYKYWASNDTSAIASEIDVMLGQPMTLFADHIYKEISSILVPSEEEIEQSHPVSLSKQQAKLAISVPKKGTKIKGVPGSGKTLVLAQRAINASKRTNEPVLILTYNITLPNYIRDKIAQMSRPEGWTNKDIDERFYRYNVHSFIASIRRKYGVPSEYEREDGNEWLSRMLSELKNRQDKIDDKFCSIFIDEVQDFQPDWLKGIKSLFLKDDGEFVLFGDEKQNVYGRDNLDDQRLPRTPVEGRWSKLTETHRLAPKIADLAEAFQNEFFSDKYELSEIRYQQQSFFDNTAREELLYYDVGSSNLSLCTPKICEIIHDFRTCDKSIAPNDICVVSDNYNILRRLEHYMRTKGNLCPTTISETMEEWTALANAFHSNRALEAELDDLRSIRKHCFQMNTGAIKLCTIHSFKGWEINTVVLWIDEKMDIEPEKRSMDELVYSAITRAKKNLIIINGGNKRYRDLFRTHCNDQSSSQSRGES